MRRLAELQQILFDEERDAYLQKLRAMGTSSPIQQLFISAVYQQALCQLLEFSSCALHSQIQERISNLQNNKLVQLRRENAELTSLNR
jgi:hypothetical protein